MKRFQPGEVPSKGPLHDCKIFTKVRLKLYAAAASLPLSFTFYIQRFQAVLRAAI